MSDTAFRELLATQPSPEARDYLQKVQRELALHEQDALWGLVAVVQEYCLSLGPPRAPATAPPAEPPSASWVFRAWQWVSAGIALQTLVLALAFFVGANWSRAPSAMSSSWLRAVLEVPAGWIIFLLMLPVLTQGAWSSWQARKRERAVAWAMLCLFTTAIVASALALAWLLY